MKPLTAGLRQTIEHAVEDMAKDALRCLVAAQKVSSGCPAEVGADFLHSFNVTPMNHRLTYRSMLPNSQLIPATHSWSVSPLLPMLQTELGDLANYDGEHHKAHAQLQDPANYARIESGLTFLGLAGLMDPPRPEVSRRQQSSRLTQDMRQEAACHTGCAMTATVPDESSSALDGCLLCRWRQPSGSARRQVCG